MLPLSPLWISCLAALFAINTGVASAQSPPNPNATWPLQSFQSTEIKTPFLNVTKNGKTELGYLFLNPQNMGTGHPAIYEDDGQLVWQGPEGSTFSFEPQMLDGQPVLLYWDGLTNSTGYGYGSMRVLNSSYQQIHEVTIPGDDFKTIYEPETFPSYLDFHEGFITEDGSMILAAVNVTEADLQSVGGPEDGWVLDALVYEIDIETNEVLFRWSAREHVSEIPLNLSRKPLSGAGASEKDPWNYIHMNSIAKYGDSYLVSSRYACSVFLISSNGTLIWHLNGIDGGDFEMGPDTTFCYQHEVRLENMSEDKVTLTAHNNENSDFTNQTKATTGLALDLDLQNKKVSLKRKLWNAQRPVVSRAQGSYQSLGNGHVLLSHGVIPVIEEYDEHGAIVMDARFGYDNAASTYRTYRHSWVGVPKTKPSVKACRPTEDGELVVYVSWNGATGVQSWKLFASSDDGELEEIKTEPRNGFETIVRAENAGDKFVVAAVGGPNDGGKSDIVTVGSCN
ncbi:uncharacterized protein CIMG_12509 [Coccidioides immitis RS]|uniref:Arylsulfotransferase n=3 Tax=Coccidioides immitis TaxID=5501 RepID=A0A0E1RUG5_COCIM|nr:uncharacterized protein CIMG_12509 [Coccidioides immitis RS]EAS27514.2 hypothetical protein CIMG_12509 [Coccidioides immitis RS]KMP09472.1 hypothetical protein CIRG_09642 [Coccidioides immitis RMSCC 2394]KMU78465.1 hypothetical protein CISG_07469 [Coccidioides immitis RMSCC 3703]